MKTDLLLITGITGHSGAWFLRRLIKENYKKRIRCLVRPNSDLRALRECNLNIELVIGDIEDEAFLIQAMKGVDTLLHIASIHYSEKVMKAALKNHVKWAVLVHTTGRYSKFKSASAEYIRVEDGILQLRDRIDITILRPTMIYGSSKDQNMYKLIDYLYRHKYFPIFGRGKNLMQPIHARDLGDAYYQVLVNQKKTLNQEYNLSGKHAIEYIIIPTTVSRLLRRKNIMVKLPMWFSLLAARLYNLVSSNPLISIEQVQRMQEDKNFSHKKATEDFGYNPLSFEQGIQEEVKEYLDKIL